MIPHSLGEEQCIWGLRWGPQPFSSGLVSSFSSTYPLGPVKLPFSSSRTKHSSAEGGCRTLMLWCSDALHSSETGWQDTKKIMGLIHQSYLSFWSSWPTLNKTQSDISQNQPWSDWQKWHSDVGRCLECSWQNTVSICQLTVHDDHLRLLSCTWACGNNLLWSWTHLPGHDHVWSSLTTPGGPCGSPAPRCSLCDLNL